MNTPDTYKLLNSDADVVDVELPAAERCVCAELGATGIGQRHTLCRAHDERPVEHVCALRTDGAGPGYYVDSRRCPACVFVRCGNPEHDHTTTVDRDGVNVGRLLPMLCNDCEIPTHYDSGVEQYVHDDVDAAPCFLVPERPDGATACADVERYAPYTSERPDLLRCRDCSTRSTLVLVSVDELGEHDAQHVAQVGA